MISRWVLGRQRRCSRDGCPGCCYKRSSFVPCLIPFQQSLISLGPRPTRLPDPVPSPGSHWSGGHFPISEGRVEGTPEAGIWSTGPVWPLALRSGTGWTVAQHLCAWGELAWQWWWEIEFPAHLGGSCGVAFLARLPEPCRAKNGALCPLPAVQLGTGFLEVSALGAGYRKEGSLPRTCQGVPTLWTSL